MELASLLIASLLIGMALSAGCLYWFKTTKGNNTLQDTQVLNYLADGNFHYVHGDLDTYSGVKHPWIWVVLDRLEARNLIWCEKEEGQKTNRYRYATKN